MTLQPGRRLGPYEILSALGAGGMGEVYKARDTRLDRIVAIKVLPADLSQRPDRRERFEREARAVSALSHPHICTLYDIGRHEGIDFLVMEHLEGDTLAERLSRGAFPLEQALRCATEIASALDAAHRRGITHRDLKPGNIMLTKAGTKLLDFGLAKLREAGAGQAAPRPAGAVAPALSEIPTRSQPLTAEGTLLGTLQYMAPEQLEGKEADARTDIFAFGMLLYEMVTGKKAFEGKSQASLIAAIMGREPAPVSTLQPLTPPSLERLVRMCLRKDPDERRQTMQDVRLDLGWIAESGPATGETGSGTAAGGARAGAARQIWMGAVLLLLLISAALAVVAYRATHRTKRVVRAFIPAPEGTSFCFLGVGAGPVAVSPDGLQIAFVAMKPDGVELLWVRALDSVEARPLPGTEGADHPFWSPDSRSLGFFASSKLKRIEASGGPALTICDVPDARGGSWSQSGDIVFSPRANKSPIFRVSASGGAPIQATPDEPHQGDWTYRWPQFLPDGRQFLFVARLIGGAEGAAVGSTVRVGSLDGAKNVVLLQAGSNAAYASGHLLFMRDRTLMAQPFDPARTELTGEPFPIAEGVVFDGVFSRGVFSASANGVLAYQTGEGLQDSQLIWFDRSGAQVRSLGDPALYVAMAISPDGQKVAASIAELGVRPLDLWIYEISRGLRTRFTFDPSNDSSPVWSPDSTRVAFSSRRSGQHDLYLKSYGGSSEEELLLKSEEDKQARSWSSDGRFLAYNTRGAPATGADIWILSLFGDRKPVPFLASRFSEAGPGFSPDGRWLAFASDESGRQEIYVAPFPGPGRKWQISSSGGVEPRWRRDGREIFYLAPNNRLVAVQVGAQGSTFVVGASSELFELSIDRTGNIYDVTADGRQFLVNTVKRGKGTAPLTLVTNWTADLGK